MPEGPEVRIMAESLNEALQGKICCRILVGPKSKYWNKPKSEYENLSVENDGYKHVIIERKINYVDAYGKKILFVMDDILFISSCGMEGHWLWEPSNNTGIIVCCDGVNAFFDDSRHFGDFRIIPHSQYSDIMKNVGKDYLRDEVSFEMFRDTIRQTKLLQKEICWFLMEQKFFSGVGNYIKADSLFLSRIAPNRLISTLSDDDLVNLYNAIMYVINQSYHCRGLSIFTYKDPSGRMGTYNHICYKRESSPEGFPIITSEFSDKRTTHWCPDIQK